MKCFIFHKWSKWIDATATYVPGLLFKDKTPYEAEVQVRKCERCGLQKVKQL